MALTQASILRWLAKFSVPLHWPEYPGAAGCQSAGQDRGKLRISAEDADG